MGAGLAAGALAALAGAPATAQADRGVSIDIGKIKIEQPLTPGGSYRLPTFSVRNPGDETTSYRLTVTGLEGAKAPGADWVHFSPGRLTLRPNQTRRVRARILLPTSADAGRYTALIGPEIVSVTGGASVGGAAAARLTFTVESTTTLGAWWERLKTFLGDHTPWSWLLPLVLLLAAAGVFLGRRYRLSVVRRS